MPFEMLQSCETSVAFGTNVGSRGSHALAPSSGVVSSGVVYAGIWLSCGGTAILLRAPIIRHVQSESYGLRAGIKFMLSADRCPTRLLRYPSRTNPASPRASKFWELRGTSAGRTLNRVASRRACILSSFTDNYDMLMTRAEYAVSITTLARLLS